MWGLDVARFGDDRTALVKRAGNVIIEVPKMWRGKDTMQVAGLIKLEYDEAMDAKCEPHEILVDVIGIGAGVVDRLRELGLPVRGINVAESPAVREQYLRLRDELWWKAREWFGNRACKIPEPQGLTNGEEDPMELLISELSQPKYTASSSGKILIETKDDMKKRGLSSPDLADAFCLTFAGGRAKVDLEQRYSRSRQRRMQQRHYSWMAA